MPFLQQHQQLLLPDCQWVAVGASTAKALQAYGITQVIYPPSEASSETLLKLPQFQMLQNYRCVIMCGHNTRDLLPTALKARGAQVQLIPVYQATCPNADIAPLLMTWQNPGIDVALATSNQNLANYYHLFYPALGEQLLRTKLLVISERMFAEAQALKFQHIFLAAGASDQAILQKLGEIKELL